ADRALAAAAAERRRDERREHGDRDEVQEAQPERGQVAVQGQPREARAERHGEHAAAGEPEAHSRSPLARSAPSSEPATPAIRIGSPPGSDRASSHASAPAATATSTSTRRRRSGTSSARNASGKTKSTPSRSGSGMTPPSRAPANVARFQVRKSDSSAPSTNANVRAPRATDTPYASSVRKYAAAVRCLGVSGTRRPSDSP